MFMAVPSPAIASRQLAVLKLNTHPRNRVGLGVKRGSTMVISMIRTEVRFLYGGRGETVSKPLKVTTFTIGPLLARVEPYFQPLPKD